MEGNDSVLRKIEQFVTSGAQPTGSATRIKKQLQAWRRFESLMFYLANLMHSKAVLAEYLYTGIHH